MDILVLRRGVLLLVGLAPLLSGAAAAADAPCPGVDLAHDVRVIFERQCFMCHGPQEEEGGLRLDLRLRVLQGGTSGPALVLGKPAESLIYLFITGLNDDKIIMPPKGRGKRLRQAECETVRRWIEAGAPWPEETRRAPAVPDDSFRPRRHTRSRVRFRQATGGRCGHSAGAASISAGPRRNASAARLALFLYAARLDD